MAFIEMPPEQGTDHLVTELFAADLETLGYVANFTRLVGRRPTVYTAWRQLITAIRGNLDTRRYELVTLAAARRLGATYCALAHGWVMRDQFYDAVTLRGIVADHHHAGLDPVEVAVMDFAEQVATDARSVTADDVAALRAHGLSDSDILDVALAAAARCFFSKVLDAMGVEPDAAYHTLLEPELHQALTSPRVHGPR